MDGRNGVKYYLSDHMTVMHISRKVNIAISVLHHIGINILIKNIQLASAIRNYSQMSSCLFERHIVSQFGKKHCDILNVSYLIGIVIDILVPFLQIVQQLQYLYVMYFVL